MQHGALASHFGVRPRRAMRCAPGSTEAVSIAEQPVHRGGPTGIRSQQASVRDAAGRRSGRHLSACRAAAALRVRANRRGNAHASAGATAPVGACTWQLVHGMHLHARFGCRYGCQGHLPAWRVRVQAIHQPGCQAFSCTAGWLQGPSGKLGQFNPARWHTDKSCMALNAGACTPEGGGAKQQPAHQHG